MRISAWILLLAAANALSQETVPEMNQKDSSPSFQSRVNLVLVPVIVRDSQGKPIDGLLRSDFQVFDRGKLQSISSFSVIKHAPAATAPTPTGSPGAIAGQAPPERYIAYLFDDLNSSAGDLMIVKKAAIGQISANMDPGDRVAIYSTSGQTTLEFTDNKAQLEEAINKIQARLLYQNTGQQCPDISYYMADLIVHKNDQQALNAATQETLACMNMTSTQVKSAETMAQSAARQELSLGEENTRVALSVIKSLIRHMGSKPGQRLIVLASPGFLAETSEAISDKAEILDLAATMNVTVNSLNVQGLFTTSMDASQAGAYSQNVQHLISQYHSESALAAEDILAELADGTGGTFFHNNNDLNEGFRRVSALPEVAYVLGFSPQQLKPDGSFHRLKIVVNKSGASLEARRGYYAIKHNRNEEENAKADIENAVFSRDEMHDIPIGLQTQFFKPSPSSAKLTVVAKIDVRRLRFKKLDGRNRDNVTIVSVLFDTDGNYITGNSKNLEMKLRDETLARLASGITLKSSFDVKPGTYVVRLVVRDSEGQAMAAQNGAVEIP